MAVSRFGVSLESKLLDSLDEYVKLNKFPNRSQAIRQLIEKNIVESKWQCNNVVAGAITLNYGLAKHDLNLRIQEVLKSYASMVLSVQQFLFENERTLQIVAVKGPSYKITELCDTLRIIKGIDHCKLVMSKTE